ncbi:DUF881 domain-containing protein [Oryzihumus leptocrescens]|uniref:Uncharacterized protein YlxW (UPF0749 family) n=1 Tax=Oryzihumus leptocrescens TaxID=297536 RepID=A0A542Z8L5_9MICO|nr:DUF881 domain-containing protein [Oryzihumus leptocrescens]TQL56688.1 uncharacterized protein YlxW (UPF0749 family) [Oryzihumus leptocrescens]
MATLPPWLTRRPSRWSLLVPVVGVAAGLLFATSAQTAKGTDLRPSGTDLADVIRAQTRVVQARTEAVRSLREQVDRLTQQSAPGNSAVNQLQQRSAALAPVAGTEAVRGPAITVTLNDAKRSAASLPQGFTADDIVVHQQDVQGVVNALWAGGAEAMMLQDQRVISTSAVRCVGNTLILQGRVYSPPYVIKAIGDVQGMQQSLDTNPTVSIYKQYVDVLGLGYDVKTSAVATFPAYTGTTSLTHASVPR